MADDAAAREARRARHLDALQHRADRRRDPARRDADLAAAEAIQRGEAGWWDERDDTPDDPSTRSAPAEDKPEQKASSSARRLEGVEVKGGGTKASSLILGFFAWVWLVLPFIRGGTPEVRAVLRAKFLNQTSKGATQ